MRAEQQNKELQEAMDNLATAKIDLETDGGKLRLPQARRINKATREIRQLLETFLKTVETQK